MAQTTARLALRQASPEHVAAPMGADRPEAPVAVPITQINPVADCSTALNAFEIGRQRAYAGLFVGGLNRLFNERTAPVAGTS